MLEKAGEKRLEDRVIELQGKPPCMLDKDLARIYGVETRRLNEARERNPRKFVEDVDYFQLTQDEVKAVDLDWKGGHLPYIYTKRGAYMFATILSTDEAIQQALAEFETLSEFPRPGRNRGLHGRHFTKTISTGGMTMLEKAGEKRLEDRVIELPGKPPCMLDKDLARAYGVETRALNQARERNPKKFTEGVNFYQLTKEEVTVCDHLGEADKYRSSLPYVYTEEGAYMFATILNTDEAIRHAMAIVKGFCTYSLLMEEVKSGRITLKPNPQPERNEVVFENMRRELLERSPLWRKILRYKGLGLNHHEIALLTHKQIATVRRNVRRMEACGLLVPPQNLPKLQKCVEYFKNRLN
ncbi:MAG: hypothetical protein HBSAPP01_13810 [Candidatus Brocadia sapporoensis]|nr:MAG: hypothetical protein HBSAPP01_13810 [Candidatus Brocadia sapporoensis]